MYFSYTGAKLRKKGGKKETFAIFGFKICAVVFNSRMCCNVETENLIISSDIRQTATFRINWARFHDEIIGK